MDKEPTDPIHWSVEEVIKEVCNPATLSRLRPNSKLPELDALAEALRANDVNGRVLLFDVDAAALRQDLGVTSLGQRGPILELIKELRSKHESFAKLSSSHLPDQDPKSPHHEVSEASVTLAKPLSSKPRPAKKAKLVHVTSSSPPKPVAFEETTIDRVTPSSPPKPRTAKRAKLIHVASLSTPKLRSAKRAELIRVLSSSSRKLRPQLLKYLAAAASTWNDFHYATANDDEKAALDSSSSSFPPKPRSQRLHYLAAAPATPDDFHHRELDDNKMIDVDSSSDDEFELIADSVISPGSRIEAARRLRCLVSQSARKTGGAHYVRLPYSRRLAPSRASRTLTAFRASRSTAQAFKSSVSAVSNKLVSAEAIANAPSEWDFLLDKYPSKAVDDDPALPIFGDSGSEGDYDSSLLDEIEAEAAEAGPEEAPKPHRNSKPTKDEVEGILDGLIESIVTEWREKKLPVLENKSFVYWRKAHSRDLAGSIARSETEVKRLHHRLTKLREALAAEEWASRAKLCEQRGNLEVTVQDYSAEQWKLALYRQDEAPPKPKRALQTLKPTKKPKHSTADSDGEDVGSDSDHMSDFVASDDEEIDSVMGDKQSPMNEESIPTATLRQTKSPGQSPHCGLQNSPPSSKPLSNGHSPMVVDSDSEDSVIGKGAGRPVDSTQANDSNNQSAFQPATDGSIASSAGRQLIEVDNLSLSDIDEQSWDILEKKSHGNRLLLKILFEMDAAFRNRLFEHLFEIYKEKLLMHLITAMNCVASGLSCLAGMRKQISDYHLQLARLIMCWILVSSRYRSLDGEVPDKEALQRVKNTWRDRKDEFLEVMKQAKENFEEIEEDEPEFYNRGKKKVFRDKDGLRLRDEAAHRRSAYEERAKQYAQHLQYSQELKTDGQGRVCINPGKEDDQAEIFISPFISSRIKKHQIEGVRFIWRELVMADESDSAQGCLLAHTMGLGKTMQAITFLATLAEASNNESPEIAGQIPHELREPRARHLILCPAGLCTNWVNEWEKWIPDKGHAIGKLWDYSLPRGPGAMLQSSRYQMVEDWYFKGGVLLISYTSFAAIFKSTSSKKTTFNLPERDQKNLEKFLTDGPGVIIADEAHKLKNDDTAIGKSAMTFKSMRRVALTGSPLANNLQEYYAMINWVAPGFLGDYPEFRDFYQRPIEEGISADSGRANQRRSMKRLRALRKTIDDKIHRADITVLEGDLPPKTEFVLKLSLSELQTRMYLYLVRLFQSQKAAAESTRLMDRMALLGLLCTHPMPFMKALSERDEKRSSNKTDEQKTRLSEAEQSVANDTMHVELGRNAMRELNAMYDQFGDWSLRRGGQGPGSCKLDLIIHIIGESMRRNDKVLVFSHRRLTLNFLEFEIQHQIPTIRMCRLDGSTDIASRTEMTKQFNEGQQDVFLISTKAGGLGLNIYGANRVILVDFDWNPQNEQQAIGRAYRMGQKKPVFVYHLVTGGTYEWPLHNMALVKVQLAARVVDRKNPTRSGSKMKDWIGPPKRVDMEDMNAFRGKDGVLDSILSSQCGRYLRSITTTETLHREMDEGLTPEEEAEAMQMMEEDRLRRLHDSSLKMQGNRGSLYPRPSSIPNNAHKGQPIPLQGFRNFSASDTVRGHQSASLPSVGKPYVPVQQSGHYQDPLMGQMSQAPSFLPGVGPSYPPPAYLNQAQKNRPNSKNRIQTSPDQGLTGYTGFNGIDSIDVDSLQQPIHDPDSMTWCPPGSQRIRRRQFGPARSPRGPANSLNGQANDQPRTAGGEQNGTQRVGVWPGNGTAVPASQTFSPQQGGAFAGYTVPAGFGSGIRSLNQTSSTPTPSSPQILRSQPQIPTQTPTEPHLEPQHRPTSIEKHSPRSRQIEEPSNANGSQQGRDRQNAPSNSPRPTGPAVTKTSQAARSVSTTDGMLSKSQQAILSAQTRQREGSETPRQMSPLSPPLSESGGAHNRSESSAMSPTDRGGGQAFQNFMGRRREGQTRFLPSGRSRDSEQYGTSNRSPETPSQPLSSSGTRGGRPVQDNRR